MRNFRIPALVLFVFAACISTGCLRIGYTLNIKPDGAGTITKTIAVSSQFAQQANMMAGGSILPTEAKLRQEAAAMGQGVRFAGSTPYKAAGFEGVTATYAFDDVTKLAVNIEGAVTGGLNMPGGDDKLDPEADVRLTFTRGSAAAPSALVMRMPKIPDASDDARKQAENSAQEAANNPQVEAMMKQMLAGMRMEVAVNVEGKIVKTNAPYVEGAKVVLLRLDGDELIKSGKGAGALLNMSKGSADVQKLLSQIPGLKIVMLPEVRIEFR